MSEKKLKVVVPTKISGDPPTCRYVRSLTLENVRTFRSHSKLDCCLPNGELAQWTIILGENGTGKTALLQYLAGMVPVQRPDVPLAQHPKENQPRIFWQPYFMAPSFLMWHLENLSRGSSQKLSCLVDLSVRASAFGKATADEPIAIGNSSFFPGTWQTTLEFKPTEDGKFSANLNTIGRHDEDFAEQFHIVAYGAGRHVAGPGSPYMSSDPFQTLDSGIETIFNEEAPLMSPEQWLLGLDHQSKGNTPAAKRMGEALKRAVACLCSVLPDVSNITIEQRGGHQPTMAVLFHTPYGPVTFAGLSLGYRAASAWIIDFVRRMHQRYPQLSEPEKGPSVVLVDEFDLHMHIRWQMDMMDRLSKTFPNTQFIITAHSPLIIQAADGKANIAVLRRRKLRNGREEVVIENDPTFVRGWRLDQLVTSDLYGLSSSRAKSYAAMIQRRTKLMQASRLTDEEAAELDGLNDRLDEESPPSSTTAAQWLDAQLRVRKTRAKPKTEEKADKN